MGKGHTNRNSYFHLRFIKALGQILALLALVLLSACGTALNEASGLSSLTETSGGYVWDGLSCIDDSTGQEVNSQNCEDDYQITGGYCYSSEGQRVDISYCTATGGGSQCYGYYYTQSGQYVYCQGSDCSGANLFETSSNQWVQCR